MKALLVALALTGSASAAELFSGRPCMGTVLEITIDHPDPAAGGALLDRAFAEAARLEQILSNWSPDAELSRFNARAGQGPVTVSPELAEVLAFSSRMHARTDGAFDVTLGPVLLLMRRGTPEPGPLREAIARVDGRALTVRGRTAELSRRGMAIDLGGVGKGYALDRLRDLLRTGGARSGFLDFGQSSQLAFGPVVRRVAVRDINGRPGEPVELRDAALSTSDSGRAESSILDPRTGALIRARRQATVICASATEAEAWTKPLIVLGRAWLSRVPGRVIYHDEDAPKSGTTSGPVNQRPSR